MTAVTKIQKLRNRAVSFSRVRHCGSCHDSVAFLLWAFSVSRVQDYGMSYCKRRVTSHCQQYFDPQFRVNNHDTV